MHMRPRQPRLLLIAALVLPGCVTVHAPLERDEAYPREWGELAALGPACKALDGAGSPPG